MKTIRYKRTVMSIISNSKGIAGEFKSFILKGNVVDLAVGVVIGAAFGKVVESVVKDLITPLIGMFGGQPDFSALKLGPLGLGNFINVLIAFVILAAVIFFLVVKPMNALLAIAKKKAEESPTGPAPVPDDVKLLMEIRDLLKSKPL
jgi:large conductance mechanosensitive channel